MGVRGVLAGNRLVEPVVGACGAAFWHQGFREENIAHGSTRKEVLGQATSPSTSPRLPFPPSSGLVPMGQAAAGPGNTSQVLIHPPQGPTPYLAAWLPDPTSSTGWGGGAQQPAVYTA